MRKAKPMNKKPAMNLVGYGKGNQGCNEASIKKAMKDAGGPTPSFHQNGMSLRKK